jgi:hypothetical protein
MRHAVPVTLHIRGRDGSCRVWVYPLTGREELRLDRALQAAAASEDPDAATYEVALSTCAGAVARVEPEGEDFPPLPDGVGGREDWLDALGAVPVYTLLGALRPRMEDRDLGKSNDGQH